MAEKLSRRKFLKLAGTLTGGILLAACKETAPPSIEVKVYSRECPLDTQKDTNFIFDSRYEIDEYRSVQLLNDSDTDNTWQLDTIDPKTGEHNLTLLKDTHFITAVDHENNKFDIYCSYLPYPDYYTRHFIAKLSRPLSNSTQSK